MNKRAFQQLVKTLKSRCKKCGSARINTTTEDEQRTVAGELVTIHWVIDTCLDCGYENVGRSF